MQNGYIKSKTQTKMLLHHWSSTFFMFNSSLYNHCTWRTCSLL